MTHHVDVPAAGKPSYLRWNWVLRCLSLDDGVKHPADTVARVVSEFDHDKINNFVLCVIEGYSLGVEAEADESRRV